MVVFTSSDGYGAVVLAGGDVRMSASVEACGSLSKPRMRMNHRSHEVYEIGALENGIENIILDRWVSNGYDNLSTWIECGENFKHKLEYNQKDGNFYCPDKKCPNSFIKQRLEYLRGEIEA